MTKKLRKLEGSPPLSCDREGIYVLAVSINALVDRVNELSEKVEQLEKLKEV